MHDRRLGRVGQVARQPLADLLHHRQLARLVVLPQAAEAAQLALEVAGRLAVALETAGAPIHRVHLGERVHQLLGEPAALLLAVELLRDLARDHGPVHLLHHVEGDAQHRLVVAGGQHARHAHRRALERAQQARLAQHVVGRRRQRRARRAAQHDARVAARDQEREVRVTLADALGLDPAQTRCRARRERPRAARARRAGRARAPRRPARCPRHPASPCAEILRMNLRASCCVQPHLSARTCV